MNRLVYSVYAVVLMASSAATATEIVVDTTVDEFNVDGDCSLREALVAANRNVATDACPAGELDAVDIVVLAAETYVVEGTTRGDSLGAFGDLDAQGLFEIRGVSSTATFIEGNNDDRIFHVNAGAEARISNLTFQNGTTLRGDGGAALLNSGRTVVEDVVFRDNRSEGSVTVPNGVGGGGAIYNTGVLTLRRCALIDNVADGGDTVDVQPRSGSGGGGAGVGGAIFNAEGAQLRIYDSTLARNQALGGTAGDLIAGGSGSSNGGGPGSLAGRLNQGNAGPAVALGGGGGGGFGPGDPGGTGGDGAFGGGGGGGGSGGVNGGTYPGGPSGLGGFGGGDGDPGDVTLGGRGGGAGAFGGAIFDAGGWVTLDHVTIVDNEARGGEGANPGQGFGAGVFTRLGAIEVRNSIIMGNVADGGRDCTDCVDCGAYGAFVDSFGHNLFATNAGCEAVDTDTTGVDPGLSMTLDRDAIAPGFALLSGSPALNGGSCEDSDGVLVTLDQRGLSRPAGGRCDVGAFEAPVSDGDRWIDADDNCPTVDNDDQLDGDGDGIGDACDTCPALVGEDPTDSDGDGVPDACDNCVAFAGSTLQTDTDGDGIGDVCDVCSRVSDPDQADVNGDGIGDACAPDVDGDGIEDAIDNCPALANPEQLDVDTNGRGDGCELVAVVDSDGDGIADSEDNCPSVPNGNQLDINRDDVGDACTPLGGPDEGGCGCSATNPPSGASPLWLIALVVGFGVRRGLFVRRARGTRRSVHGQEGRRS